MSIIETAKRVDEAITAIKQAFGAPGDHGYETREGRALYQLYLCQADLRDEIKAQSERA